MLTTKSSKKTCCSNGQDLIDGSTVLVNRNNHNVSQSSFESGKSLKKHQGLKASIKSSNLKAL